MSDGDLKIVNLNLLEIAEADREETKAHELISIAVKNGLMSEGGLRALSGLKDHPKLDDVYPNGIEDLHTFLFLKAFEVIARNQYDSADYMLIIREDVEDYSNFSIFHPINVLNLIGYLARGTLILKDAAISNPKNIHFRYGGRVKGVDIPNLEHSERTTPGELSIGVLLDSPTNYKMKNGLILYDNLGIPEWLRTFVNLREYASPEQLINASDVFGVPGLREFLENSRKDTLH